MLHTATRHGKRSIRLTEQEIRNYRRNLPAVPPRITELLSVARANLLFIPRETVAHLPCDPLLDKYLSLKSELADAITESENGTPCQMLDLAEHLFVNGTAETLVEGWVRAWIATEGEQAAQEMLAAGKAQQEQFRLIDRVDAAIAYGQVAEMFNDQHEVAAH